MEVFKVRCTNPRCRQTLSIPQSAVGKQVKCAKCDHTFLVPLTIHRLLSAAPPALHRKAG